MKLKDSYSLEEKLWKTLCVKKHRYCFTSKGPYSQSYGFSSNHVWMWELDHKESWAEKNWCFQIVVPEKTLESPLDSKETRPVNPKGNQPKIFIGRTDAEALILWPPDANSRFTGNDPDVGKGWTQEKGMTEDEMVGEQWTWVWASCRTWWRTGKLGVLQSMEVTKGRTQLTDWTTTTNCQQFGMDKVN